MRPVLLLLAFAVLAAGCGGDGGERLSGDDLPRAPAALRVSSPAFIDGSRLPPRYTCDGAGEDRPSRPAPSRRARASSSWSSPTPTRRAAHMCT